MRLARSIKVVFGFAAIGSGSILLTGTALADTAQIMPISVVSTDAKVSIDSSSQHLYSTQLKNEKTTTSITDTSSSVISVLATKKDDSSITKSDLQTPANYDQTPQASKAGAESSDVSSKVYLAETMSIVVSQPIISVQRHSTYGYLTSSFGAASPSYDSASVVKDASVNQPQAKSPSIPLVPVAPFEAVGTLLSLFANALPVRFLDLDLASLGFTFLSLLFIVLAGRLHGAISSYTFNFGAWLKQTGYIAVTSAGLPATVSNIFSSVVTDYVSAPAPYA